MKKILTLIIVLGFGFNAYAQTIEGGSGIIALSNGADPNGIAAIASQDWTVGEGVAAYDAHTQTWWLYDDSQLAGAKWVAQQGSITVTDGSGFDLTIAGTTISFAYDWTELTSATPPANASDYLMYYDVSAGDYKTMTISDAIAYWNTTTITAANTTLDATHNTILADASSNAVTLDLPDATTVAGRTYTIKAEDVTNAVTIDGNAAQTIDGAATLSLTSADDAVTIQSDGANWVVVSEKTAAASTAFTLAGDGGVNQTIDAGNTLTVAGGAGITTTGAATDQLNVVVDINPLSAATLDAADEILISDPGNSNAIEKTTIADINNLHSFTLSGDSGTDQTITNGNTLEVNGAAESNITVAAAATDAVQIDISYQEYISDAAASTGGIAAGQYYRLGVGNIYGAAIGTLRRRQ